MDSTEYVSKPINIIFNGSNYDIWAKEMCSFLKVWFLWHIMIGEVSKPIQKEDKDEEKIIEWLDKWDGKNHQILS